MYIYTYTYICDKTSCQVISRGDPDTYILTHIQIYASRPPLPKIPNRTDLVTNQEGHVSVGKLQLSRPPVMFTLVKVKSEQLPSPQRM